ncbi:MAG: hypothetical protein B7Y03_00610 [Polaromonas sp. 24-62-144]|jgi:hypothetical protein|uniref:hypothetical protein n=1 Tax=Polaromonas sp. TaxID=1869339 RepID=UPI000BDBCB97|nr:hypothetical protein [Polaromonas sp.]OYZ85199.1 MAG: hypothetical protein B7Y03_00610 [Polaromonas sp. 24-62-144]HQS31908.1 hypothetical protein [Polaromonas sp.]
MLYSPQPAESYSSGNSGILAGDPEAWNLAWVSHGETFHPDPHFTTLVRRTLQFVLETGGIDLIDQVPTIAKVRGLMRLTAPQAVGKLLQARYLTDMPLYSAYGMTWINSMVARARLYREPEHIMLDRPVTDLTQARVVIEGCR